MKTISLSLQTFIQCACRCVNGMSVLAPSQLPAFVEYILHTFKQTPSFLHDHITHLCLYLPYSPTLKSTTDAAKTGNSGTGPCPAEELRTTSTQTTCTLSKATAGDAGRIKYHIEHHFEESHSTRTNGTYPHSQSVQYVTGAFCQLHSRPKAT